MEKKKNKGIRYISIIIILLLIILLLLKFCNDKDKDVERPKDGSKPSIAALEIKILSLSKEEIHFAINFTVFRDSKNIEDAIKSKHITIDSLKRPQAAFKQLGFNKLNGGKKEPFSAILLVDQSASMTSNDKENKRFMSARIFNSNFGNDNYLMLWCFGSGKSKYQSLSDGFVKDTTLFENQLKVLQNMKPSGGSPLFNAQDSTLQYLNQYANTKIKALVSLTDGVAGGKSAYSQAVSTSLESQIPLYNITLIKKSELLENQAFETHGAYIQVDDIDQLKSVFGNLGSLIDKTATIYNTEWIATPVKGNFGNKGRIRHEMIIQLPYKDHNEIKLPFELEW